MRGPCSGGPEPPARGQEIKQVVAWESVCVLVSVCVCVYEWHNVSPDTLTEIPAASPSPSVPWAMCPSCVCQEPVPGAERVPAWTKRGRQHSFTLNL